MTFNRIQCCLIFSLQIFIFSSSDPKSHANFCCHFASFIVNFKKKIFSEITWPISRKVHLNHPLVKIFLRGSLWPIYLLQCYVKQCQAVASVSTATCISERKKTFTPQGLFVFWLIFWNLHNSSTPLRSVRIS